MKKWFITIGLVVAASTWLISRNSVPVEAKPVFKASAQASMPSVLNTEKEVAPLADDRQPAASGRDPLELRSLNELTETVAATTQPNAAFSSLVERLQRGGQNPHVIRDANPDSGEMLIVRTESPLAGTRYFHAQYFTNESGERFAQHISFEFKPGPDAMAEAVAAVERNFSDLSVRTHERSDYVRWKLGDDRVVWVKKLNEEDLNNDPFNAYTKEDVGAVRVAIEQDPHADGHDD